MSIVVRTLALFILLACVVVCASPPALAISADLAKKCRDMAIKSHPPPVPLGNKAYAGAEREFFSQCVARNGNMEDTNTAPKDKSDDKKAQ